MIQSIENIELQLKRAKKSGDYDIDDLKYGLMENQLSTINWLKDYLSTISFNDFDNFMFDIRPYLEKYNHY